ncbi:uncharacterized protein LOC133196676 [Saccostrea echinata]|uniref:uncharacterized protein LOC133196676 n=1 Tax=Saccostrea echinata TaxID=191078 RepID=UPI002A7FCF74|nr:uncharacterized protein LOC133196676 [Saccostrea echinata]XP_061188519.1 uncharacterized protein LOC133196676 [Saccostrea echinata]
MNRNTLLTCNGASDRRCGSCLKGFYMAFHHDEECVSCRNDRLNRPECVTYRQVVLSTTHSTSKMPIDREQTITISGLEAQREGKSEILTSVVLVLMAVAIICAIVLIFVKSKKGDHDSTRTDKTQDNPWGSTSTRLDETDLEADCILLRENLDENDRVELNAAFDVAITRDDPLLLRVAKHIDNEPEEIFEDLGIPKNIFFQTEKNICIQVGSQIADVYYGVLQKWVERSGRAATKRVLFRAFEKFGMASVCQVLIDDTKTF